MYAVSAAYAGSQDRHRVLYLKGMNLGPTLFVDNPPHIYAVFIVFILAQLLMLRTRAAR